MNAASRDRVDGLISEKVALVNLVETLTSQNKEILVELETHMQMNDRVRETLDRKAHVCRMLNNFNKDLCESKRAVENSSPQRFRRTAAISEVQFVPFGSTTSRQCYYCQRQE